MGVAERSHRQAAEEIEITASGRVEEHAALAPDEGHRRFRIGLHERGAVDRSGHDSNPTIVPIPSSVNTSSNRAWGVRPSRMCAWPTPARTARAQACTFGIIPPVAAPVLHHPVEIVGGRPMQECRRVVGHRAQTGDVGEEHQFLGLECGGEGTGRGIRVDVEGLTRSIGADGRDHRDQPLGEQLLDDDRVDRGDVADVAESLGPRSRRDQVGVFPRQADREGGMDVDRADDVAIHLADQHHPDQVNRLGVGHPMPVEELDLLAHSRHQRPDLGPAAVDDHREHADRTHEDDVLGERRRAPSASSTSRPSEVGARTLPPYLTTTTFPQKRRM